MLALSIAEGFSRGLLSFHPASAPASPENSLSSIIPIHARPSRKSNYSRTSATPGGGGIYRFLCQTNSPRSFHRNPALRPIFFQSLAHSSIFRSTPISYAPNAFRTLSPKTGGYPCMVIPIQPLTITAAPRVGFSFTSFTSFTSSTSFTSCPSRTDSRGPRINYHQQPVPHSNRGDSQMISMTPEQAAFL